MAEPVILSQQHAWVQHVLYEMRDVSVHVNRLIFRQNLRKLGWALGLALSSKLTYHPVSANTPLGQKICQRMVVQPVLAMVLRAGLPLAEGLLDIFPDADVSFTGAMRKEDGEDELNIELSYQAAPSIEKRPLILIDPMLATGSTIVEVASALMNQGRPSEIFVVSALASAAGIRFVSERLPQALLYLADVDPELNDKKYIVPGLGDAGDLCFGLKR